MMKNASSAMDGSLQNLKAIEKINYILVTGTFSSCAGIFFLPDVTALIAIHSHAQ